MDNKQIEILIPLLGLSPAIDDYPFLHPFLHWREIDKITTTGDGLNGPVKQIKEFIGKWMFKDTYYRKDGLVSSCIHRMYYSNSDEDISDTLMNYYYSNDLLSYLMINRDGFLWHNHIIYDENSIPIKMECQIFSSIDENELIGTSYSTYKLYDRLIDKSRFSQKSSWAERYLDDKNWNKVHRVVTVSEKGKIKENEFYGILEVAYGINGDIISCYDSGEEKFVDYVAKKEWSRDQCYISEDNEVFAYTNDEYNNWIIKTSITNDYVIRREIIYYE